MDLLQQSAQAWKEITEYRYLFTYGYKKQLYPINLTFSLEDYPHLAGFQYMKDISLPNYSSAKIADRILEGKILFEKVQEAAQYEDMIKPRLEALVHLKESLDNEFNLYSYMPRMYPFIIQFRDFTQKRGRRSWSLRAVEIQIPPTLTLKTYTPHICLPS